MSVQRRVIYGVMLLLVAITAYSIIETDTVEPVLYSGTYETIIWTDKESYKLGEPVEAAIVFVNPNDHQLTLAPLYRYNFGGNSLYEPEKSTTEVYAEYAEPSIVIPENGETTIINTTLTPTYPGPFIITGLGATKTVNVTGYKEVMVNSTGISLKMEPETPVLRDKENVWFYLVIVNDNPYPVKIPVFNKLGYNSVPVDPGVTMMVDWIMTHYTIEANSEKIVMRRQFRVTQPGFSIYYYIRGVMVSFEGEVIP